MATFMLVYGFKVMLPVKVVVHTNWLTTFQEDLDNKALMEALDFLPLQRGDARLKEEIT